METEICEWCKEPVRMMCQKGTAICSPKCLKYAVNVLHNDDEAFSSSTHRYCHKASE